MILSSQQIMNSRSRILCFMALSMDEKDVDLWWDVVQDIVYKYIGKVCRKYERNERLYRHMII